MQTHDQRCTNCNNNGKNDQQNYIIPLWCKFLLFFLFMAFLIKVWTVLMKNFDFHFVFYPNP